MAEPRKGLFARLTETLFEDVKEAAPRPSRAVERAPDGLEPAAEPVAGAEPIGWDAPRPKKDLAEPVGWDAPIKPPEPEKPRSFVKEPFEKRLRELIESGQAAGIAQLRMVGVDQLKDALGERWEAAQTRARELLHQTIEKRIGDDDIYITLDDNRFCILFPNLTPDQAEFKANAILMEVRERLMGEFSLPDVGWVQAIVGNLQELNLNQTLVTLGDLDAALADKERQRLLAQAAIQREEEKAGMQAPEIERSRQAVKLEEEIKERLKPGGQPKGSAGKLQLIGLSAVREELGEKWAEIADRARDIADHVISTRIGPADVMAAYDKDSFLILFAELDEEEALLRAAALAREIRERLLGELKLDKPPELSAQAVALAKIVSDGDLGMGGDLLREIDDFIATTEDVAPEEDALDDDLRDELGEVRAIYRPTWFVTRNLITIFDARPLRLLKDGTILRGAQAYPPENRASVLFEIDRALLKQGLADLAALVHGGGKAVVQVPMHVITLMAHSRGQLVDLIRSQRADLRKLLVIELIASDAPAPAAAIASAAKAVQPFCRGVSVRVPPDFPEIDRLTRLGLLSAGIDLDLDPDAPPPGFKMLEAFAKRCRGAGLGAHLYGVIDPAILRFAEQDGFTYVNGPAVARDTGRPGEITMFRPR